MPVAPVIMVFSRTTELSISVFDILHSAAIEVNGPIMLSEIIVFSPITVGPEIFDFCICAPAAIITSPVIVESLSIDPAFAPEIVLRT